MSNLDVWAIQYYPLELMNALKCIDGGMNIIYSNLTCKFKVGNKSIDQRQFDTILYNKESDILIMLMRGGVAKKKDIINYLNDNNKEYCEIVFSPSVLEYRDSEAIPELWFAREKYVLDDALNDSRLKGIDYLDYYPNVLSSIDLGYITNNSNKDISIDGRLFKGLIKLDDKVVFIINQKNNKNKNMNMDEVINIIKNHNMIFNVDLKENVDIVNNDFPKQKQRYLHLK